MLNPRTSSKISPKATRSTRAISEFEAEISVEVRNRKRLDNAIGAARIASGNSKSRRIAIALLTLSWSSSNAPLRSILNGFYYLAAIISLILLIAFFNQAKSQQAEHRVLRQKEFLQSVGSGSSLAMSRLANPTRPTSERRTQRNTTNRDIAVKGTKTAERLLIQTLGGSANLATSSKRPALPELTYRSGGQSGENSLDTRRSNETQSSRLSSSQWTPILQNNNNNERRQLASASLPAPIAVPPTIHLVSMGQESRHHHRHNREPDHSYRTESESRRIWRRPRLNSHATSGYRQGKMYKRVLICDKTLVSLDYLRDFGAEPRPYPMAHYSFGDLSAPVNFVDDNSIDLDLNGGQSGDVFSRRASTISGFTSNLSTSIPSTPTTMMPSAHPDIVAAETATYPVSAERRSGYQYNLLPDDDALVKCDMWDLEKGLKNRKPPADILDLAVKADFDTVRDAINRCRQLSEKTLPPDDEYRDGLEIMSSEDFVSLFSMKRGLLPGTKWCGLGDQASTYNDLGPKHRIDICCRAHDHCPIRLKPFRNDYGVLNIALYTKSHCDCDADFYRCLREAHSRTADMLGNLYFNVMKLQCIREERLKVCRELRPIALGFERCVRYEENPMRRVFKFTTPPVAY